MSFHNSASKIELPTFNLELQTTNILFSYSHDYLCDSKQLEECAMSAGYTGHLNNLDYTICIEEEYGFCGIKYMSIPDEVGSFSLTNKTELQAEAAYDEIRLNSG